VTQSKNLNKYISVNTLVRKFCPYLRDKAVNYRVTFEECSAINCHTVPIFNFDISVQDFHPKLYYYGLLLVNIPDGSYFIRVISIQI